MIPFFTCLEFMSARLVAGSLCLWLAAALLFQFPIVSAEPPRLQQTDSTIRVSHDDLEVVWDKAGSGGPARIQVQDRLFELEDAVPVYAEVWDVAARAPFSDRLDGMAAAGHEEGVEWHTEATEDAVTVRVSGIHAWPGDADASADRLHWQVAWRFSAAAPGIAVDVDLGVSGAWHQRVFREISWQLPLGLDFRKRVAQGGEQGLDWDTRYFYSFFTRGPGLLMPHPEVNVWRHFAVEQETADAFRIWRAQEDTTAPLVMEHGGRAAGWTGIYDRFGGYMVACQDLAGRAPASLRVDARGEGLFRVQFLPPTAPAADPNSAAFHRSALGQHRIELMPYAGAWDYTARTAALRDAWGVERLASDPVETRTVPGEDWLEETGDPQRPLIPVTGGVPLERGLCAPEDGFRVFLGERELPVQARPIAYWPDGSVKWALLSFPLDASALAEPGAGEGDEFEVEVSLRDESRLPIRVRHGPDVVPGRVANPVRTHADDTGILLDNGPLRMLLQGGAHWLAVLQREGRNLLRVDGAPVAFVDYLHLDAPHRVDQAHRPFDTHAQGQRLPGPVRVTDLRLEESGPLRAVVRLEGETKGEEPVKVILRVEVYAGSEWVRMWKTVEFLDADPRQRMVHAMGLSLPLDLAPEGLRFVDQDGVVEGEGTLARSLLQFSPRGYRDALALADGTEETLATGTHSQGWLGMAGAEDAVTVVQRNFWQQAPRENRAVAGAEPALTAYFRPDATAVMDVRRYSDFPHWSQGESVASNNNYWVYDSYYRNDPFKGISRTFETLWGFHHPDMDTAALSAVAADFHSRPLVYAGEQRYRELGVALPWGDVDNYPEISRNLDNIADFWLWNQHFYNWFGPWRHGDTVHGHSRGYGYILKPEELAALLELPEDKRYETRAASGGHCSLAPF